MAKGRLNLSHFASRANEAAFWEAWTGAVLARCGLYTVHHPFTVANHVGEIHQYAHTWDLDVSTRHPAEAAMFGGSREVEVKSLNLDFVDTESYPNQQVLVCSAASHRRKFKENDFLGRDFLLLSRFTGAIVWVPPDTPLKTRQITDSDRGESYKALACRKEDLRALKDFVKTFSD